MPRSVDLELNPLTDSDSFSDPDLPLTVAQPDTTPKPRWLNPRASRFACLPSSPAFERCAEQLRHVFRPRLMWKYVFCSVVGVYVLYCFVTRQPLFSSPLPAYSGPHEVGAVDLEIPVEKPRRISETLLKETKKPAFELETVLFTVYYPAEKGARSHVARHLWVPRPISLTAEGYARIAGVNNFIIRPIFTFALWLLVGSIEIPAKVDVPILGSDGGKFPVMVFSHGMASSRTDYTHYLGELASRGHVVAAIEHRDGSCPGSLVKLAGKEDRRVLLVKERDLMSDPPMDETKIKKEQLAFRDAEIFETIRVLQNMNEGKGEEIFASNSRKEGYALASWSDRLDFQHLTINGHSYGATGAMQALKNANTTSNPSIGGIILDPGKSSGQLNADISVPLLVVHSNSWSKSHSIFFGSPHFDTVRGIVRGVRDRVGAAWFLTSVGTAHPSVTDAPLLQPLLLGWATAATADVEQALGQYVDVTLDFLQFLHNGQKKGVLAEEVTHEQYGEWISQEREREFPTEIAKWWEVHVTPKQNK